MNVKGRDDFPIAQWYNTNMTITIRWVDTQGEKTKTFTCQYKARSFYCRKFKEGKSPKIVGATR